MLVPGAVLIRLGKKTATGWLAVALAGWNATMNGSMVSSLGESFAGTGTSWSSPPGGLYVWVTFPDHVNAAKLQPIAFEAGVGFQPGPNFAPNDNGDNCARLCFGYESPEKNRDGVALLSEVMDRKGLFKVAPGG